MHYLAIAVSATTIGATALAWYAYACTACTWLLKLLPSPEETVSIFMLKVPPRPYLIFFNLMRWLSGNNSWVDSTIHAKSELAVTSTPGD